MDISLNHTIVSAKNPELSALFLSEILGLPPPETFGHFTVVQVGVTSLDFAKTDGDVHPQHYAFLVTEADFDAIFARIKKRGLDYWADPFHKKKSQINTRDGGRGVYWEDPDGHLLEILTRPYGSGS